MICRMNKLQRKALIELIECIVENHFSHHVEDSIRRMELEEEFHKLFGNESEIEDNTNHAASS